MFNIIEIRKSTDFQNSVKIFLNRLLLDNSVNNKEPKLKTAKDRISYVAGFYHKNQGGQNPEYTWDDAVSDANESVGTDLFKNGKSFLNARRNLNKREQSKRC